MTVIWASVAISAAGVIISAVIATFIAGTRWGEVKRDIATLKQGQQDRATKADVQAVDLRLARIEGMFEIRLRPTVGPAA